MPISNQFEHNLVHRAWCYLGAVGRVHHTLWVFAMRRAGSAVLLCFRGLCSAGSAGTSTVVQDFFVLSTPTA